MEKMEGGKKGGGNNSLKIICKCVHGTCTSGYGCIYSDTFDESCFCATGKAPS